MASYKVSLSFTEEQVQDMNGAGYKLCFTSGVGDSNTYNVIAWTQEISDFVNITWTDVYSIAATKSTFSNGAVFDIATKPKTIKFKEIYTLPKSWTGGSTAPDSSLQEGMFAFKNQTDDKASAVVMKMIGGKPTAFYISESPVLSSGTEKMVPKNMIALWFQKKSETGKMISLSSSEFSEFDMTGVTTLSAEWNGSRFIKSKSRLNNVQQEKKEIEN